MQTMHTTSARKVWRIAICVLAMAGIASSLRAQDAVYPSKKPSPPKIATQIVLLEESVVQTQWVHTLNLVNAPQNVTLLNPGQCIRVGIYATGENRDSFLQETKLSFNVQFADHSDNYPLEYPRQFKQIKPEGGDFVKGALRAAGVKQPPLTKTFASLGVSAGRWCVPVNASDGTAAIEAEAESPTGRERLHSSTVQIESFETGSKKFFKGTHEYGEFLQTYYRQPNPARLLPALQFTVADQTQNPREGQAEIVAAFLSAALKVNPIAARNFRTRVATQPPLIRAFGLLALSSAGYDISGVLNTLSAEDQQKFLSLPQLQNPYDLTPTKTLFMHLDMLWAVFGATGQFEPVKTIANMLGWRADYEDFKNLRKASTQPLVPTPPIVRGIVYTAAGWSLKSFQERDSLVADYVDYMLASPDIPQSVKSGLNQLSSDPAFNRAGGQ